MLEKATDPTDYLADAYYCGANYIRSLMWSQATTKYKFHSILKIEEVIDVTESQQRCDRVKAGAVEVIKLTKTDCGLWSSTFLSFFFPFSHDILFTSHLEY